MNPVPITLPTGDIHAYACETCGFVAGGWRHSGEWNERDVERTREEAEACCVCATCKAPLADGYRECPACSERKRAAWAAQNAVTVVREATSFAEAEAEHLDVWAFTLDNGRTGRVYLCDEGMFYNAFARLDPTEDDPDPPADSATLKRRSATAVLDAIDAVCMGYDADVERMEKVP